VCLCVGVGRRFTPAPDSLFDKARQDAEYINKLDPRQQAMGGLDTPAGSAGMATPLADLKQIGEARGTVLGVKLDQVHTETVTDKATESGREGYSDREQSVCGCVCERERARLWARVPVWRTYQGARRRDHAHRWPIR
jgi:hypothetical protein